MAPVQQQSPAKSQSPSKTKSAPKLLRKNNASTVSITDRDVCPETTNEIGNDAKDVSNILMMTCYDIITQNEKLYLRDRQLFD